MSEHTPGPAGAPFPWKPYEQDWRAVVDADGNVVADIRVGGSQEGRMCAHLISKAWLLPEMVEALRMLTADRSPGECPNHEDGWCSCNDGVEKALDLLQRFDEASEEGK